MLSLRKNVLTGQERFTVQQGATFLMACLPTNPQCVHTDRGRPTEHITTIC